MSFREIMINMIPFFVGFVLGSFFGIGFSAFMNVGNDEIDAEERKDND